MKVYAIYGSSGTGKSTSALSYAHDHKIEAIIDDGLLIKNGKRIAGISAKFEKNALTAVKRAIFADATHLNEVVEAIENEQIQSILLLGTSKKMTIKIAEQLKIDPIHVFIRIEDIRSQEEILLAQHVRELNGTHTMPLPPSEIAQNFFSRMIQKGKDIFSAKKEKIGETTIVLPDFHTPTIFIHPKTYDIVLKEVTLKHQYVEEIHKVQFQFTEHLPFVYIEISLQAPVTYNVWDELTQLQVALQEAFLQTFELKLTTITIHVKSIVASV